MRRGDHRLNHRIRWIWLAVAVVALGIAFLQTLAPRKPHPSGSGRPRLILFPAPETNLMPYEEAKKCLVANPNDVKALTSVMIYYQQQGRWRDSVVLARRIVANYPQEVLGHLGLAYALQNLGATEEAIKVVQQALERPFTGFDRGQLLRVLGDLRLVQYAKHHDAHILALAEQHYQEAHALRTPLAMVGMARVAIARGQDSVARLYLTQVYSRSPYPRERALAAYYLGYLAERRNLHEESKYWYGIAVRTHPHSFVQNRLKE